VPPGTTVTQQFTPLRQVMSGSPAPLDAVLQQLARLRDTLERLGPEVDRGGPIDLITDPGFSDQRRALKQDAANLPPPVNALIVALADNAGAAVGHDVSHELARRYAQEVVPACHLRLDGRYPFVRSSTDLSLGDFADVFGPGGLYDKFFTDRLAKLVDTTQRPWIWRPGSGDPSAAMLAQFERADAIQRMFFPSASKAPKLSFVVGLSGLDPAATRVYALIEGQNFAVRPGEETARTIEWPGPQTSGVAYVTFEDRIAAPQRALEFNGPWAWFRLIDASVVADGERRPGDLQSVLHVRTPHHRAQLTVQANNVLTNPFAERAWRSFSCGS
jgi:type VI secretion system protein ImpL